MTPTVRLPLSIVLVQNLSSIRLRHAISSQIGNARNQKTETFKARREDGSNALTLAARLGESAVFSMLKKAIDEHVKSGAMSQDKVEQVYVLAFLGLSSLVCGVAAVCSCTCLEGWRPLSLCETRGVLVIPLDVRHHRGTLVDQVCS